MKGFPNLLKQVLLSLVLVVSATSLSFGQDGGDPAKGKQLFNQNCAACHALNR
ncbi:MAG: c-type cytochrome, partial [Flavobacteriaceae bacterium]